MSDERKDWLIAGLCTMAAIAAVVLVATSGGAPEVTPEPSVPVTLAPSTPGASMARTAAPGTQELPDCEYRLPPCVRAHGDRWILINDYQGDQRPVTLVGTVVRGDVVYRIVKG